MYDVITIGGAVRDFTFYIESPEAKSSKFICFLPGTKINIRDAYFTHGGGACNVSVGLANFGLKVASIIRVGQDYSGRAIIDGLKKRKIETRFVQIDKKLHTGISAIIQPKGGERIILTYRGANDKLEIPDSRFPDQNRDSDKDRNQIPDSRWVYVASLSGEWEKILNKIYLQLTTINSQPKIAWNPGMIQLQAGKKKLAKFLKKTEVLILNKSESAMLTGESEKNIPLLLKSLYKLGPKIVAVTCGKDGAYVIDKNEVLYEPAHSTKVVDTTGAGDSFSSGFLAGLILFHNARKALKLGILNSAANLRVVGAQDGLLTKKALKKLRL